MAKKNESKRPRHDYDEMREVFRMTPTTVSVPSFARKVKIPLRTLQNKMKKDADEGNPWERDLAGDVKRKTKQMQQRVSAGLAQDQPITEEAVAVAAAAATNMLVLESHQGLFTQLKELSQKGMAMLSKQIQAGTVVVEQRIKGGTELVEVDVDATYIGKATTNFSTTVDKVVKLERHHLGLDDEGGDSYESELEELTKQLEDAEAEEALIS